MHYLLDERKALRSWDKTPYAVISRNTLLAKAITKEAYELLLLCDGCHDVPQSELLLKLLLLGYIRPCEPGEKLDDWQKEKKYDNRLFSSMNWAITGLCNMNCRHCFMAKDASPMMGEFSLAEAEDFISQCEDCGIQSVNITGGEPFMHKNIFEILDSCRKHHIFVSDINTNGVLITKDTLSRISGLGLRPRFKISFDGLGYHEWFRGIEGAEAKTLSAIELCIAEGFDVAIQTNVCRHNLPSLADTISYLDEMGVSWIRVIMTTDTDRWKIKGDGSHLSFDEFYDGMLMTTESLLSRKLHSEICLWQFLSFEPEVKTYHIDPLSEASCGYFPSEPVCPYARSTIAVDYTGEVSPCNPFSGYLRSRGISYGNVKSTPLSSILKEGCYHDMVTTTVEAVREHNESCRNCQYWEKCRGGCPAFGMLYSGDFLHNDPSKCLFFQNGYEEKIRKLMDRFGYHCR